MKNKNILISGAGIAGPTFTSICIRRNLRKEYEGIAKAFLFHIRKCRECIIKQDDYE